MPLAKIGLAVPVTLVWKLVDIIGVGKTYELLFTGEAVGAETEAHLVRTQRFETQKGGGRLGLLDD